MVTILASQPGADFIEKSHFYTFKMIGDAEVSRHKLLRWRHDGLMDRSLGATGNRVFDRFPTRRKSAVSIRCGAMSS